MPSALLQDAAREARNRGTLEGMARRLYRIHMRTKTRRSIIVIPALFCAVSLALALDISREHGDRLERKIDDIVKNAGAEPVKSKKTPASEQEVNSYLNFNVKEQIPRGLSNPQVSLLGNGSLGGRVYVDLDEFKRRRGSAGMMDPLNFISGRVPLTARGVLRTREGRGQFQLSSAEIHRVPIPKPLLQELVTFFSRTEEKPGGINLDEPFNLPAKVREVIVNQGEAVVVQ